MDFLTDLESCVPGLRRYARALLRHPDDADDLVQDCLERAIARRHLWYGGSSLRPWLFRILRNLHANGIRARRARPAPEPLDAAERVPGEEGPQSVRVALREMEEALLRLSGEQREVVLMVALTGMSYQDCAAALGVPIGTVMSRLARGRERLRQMLEGETPTRAEPLLRRVK
jgi:RNA polymerase sigma-70 factor, ECF subfamily